MDEDLLVAPYAMFEIELISEMCVWAYECVCAYLY